MRGKLEFDKSGNLVGVDLAETDFDHRCRYCLLVALPRLRSVRLSGSEITSAGLAKLCVLAHLADLSLQDTQIDNVGFRTLTSMKKLQSLLLRRSNNLTDDALSCLKEFPTMTRLALIEDNFSDEGLEHLKELTQLQVLDLRGCSSVGDAGLRRLRHLKNLKGLKIGGMAITDAGLGVLKSFSPLESLTLEDCNVSDEGIAQLDGLPIEDLAVVRCFSVGDKGMERFESFSPSATCASSYLHYQ